MKILHLNTDDSDGGAAIACYRIHQGLLSGNVSSKMLVQYKYRSDKTVVGPTDNAARGMSLLRPPIDHLPKLAYRKRLQKPFHAQWLPSRVPGKIRKLRPDIVHLHWICKAFVPIHALGQMPRPIVWTLHDMWPFTGGCHYSEGCDRYQKSCGNCPQLASRQAHDISRWTWGRKKKAWRNIAFTLVAPSHWIKTKIEKSSLLQNHPVEVIQNGIDLNIFRPIDRKITRSILNFPPRKKLILFIAINADSDERKGFQYLLPSIQAYAKTPSGQSSELIIVGASRPLNQPNFGLNATYMGTLKDELSIAMVYAACDICIIPSIEDNLPSTIMEAMACGTPCAAFRIGGLPEMISHQVNGYLAKPRSISDLTRGIEWIVTNKNRQQLLSEASRQKAQEAYDINQTVKKYSLLYNKVIKNS